MKIISRVLQRCYMCSETHDVLIVEETQKTNYKGEEIVYSGVYEYCEHADEMFESEEMINVNRLKLIDVYRAKVGLLNSSQIVALREKYKLSQKDFSEMLEWGLATITRYENHQVQDRVHDDVMRKLDMDPVWFIELLERSKERLKPKVYLRSLEAAKRVHNDMRMHYIKIGLMRYEDGQMNDLSISESDGSIEELVEAIKAMIKAR